MKKSDILKRLDHTLLKPDASWKDYSKLAEEAWQSGVASVCVPPSRVSFMQKQLGGRVPICTVVGFPCGYSTTETKCWETQQAILQGAKEIDMVIDIGMAAHAKQQWEWNYIRDEISRVRAICRGDIILKVIIETCFLGEAEKMTLCMIASDSGVDYLKTSTGFGPKGAKLADVELFRSCLSEKVKIKAAGGIDTIEKAKQFIEAGCERIGSSKLVKLLNEIDGDDV